MSLLLALMLAAAPPQVAILSAAGGDGDFAELRFQPVGTNELSPAVTRFTIVPRSTVTGVLLPGTRVVLAVALLAPAADESWAFSLLRLEPGKPAKRLAERIGAATRPLVTPTGRVFVERGSGDELRIDEVNPGTGALRAVLQTRGYYAALAGALGSELFVYRVDASGARLEAVNVDSREVRLLRAGLPALAHDFAVDSLKPALLYTLGDPRTHEWHVERLDLKSLHVRTVAQGPSVALLPTVFPDGRMGYAPRAGAGLVEAALESPRVLVASQGPGYERVSAFADGLAIGLHERPSEFPLPFAVSLVDGSRVTLLAPSQSRLEIAGVAR